MAHACKPKNMVLSLKQQNLQQGIVIESIYRSQYYPLTGKNA